MGAAPPPRWGRVHRAVSPALAAIADRACPWRPCHRCHRDEGVAPTDLGHAQRGPIGERTTAPVRFTAGSLDPLCPLVGAAPPPRWGRVHRAVSPALAAIADRACPWRPCHRCHRDEGVAPTDLGHAQRGPIGERMTAPIRFTAGSLDPLCPPVGAAPPPRWGRVHRAVSPASPPSQTGPAPGALATAAIAARAPLAQVSRLPCYSVGSA